jgi:nicotinate-nucleotide adenylyltransferase
MEENNISQGVLCFGGSFNPIHNAHLECCRIIANSKNMGRILLIPTAESPHKPGHRDMASATDRLTMCRIAVSGESLFEVSDIEFGRSGPSYTIDTVRDLRRMGHGAVSWLIGADMLMMLPKWHKARELIAEARILVMRRPGVEIRWTELPPAFRSLEANVVDAPLIDISATDIRNRVKAGLPIAHLTPPAVARYISDHKLYRA